jgi:hypothetical protein
MDWQQPASILLAALAAVFLFRQQFIRSRRARQSACGSDCDCTGKGKTG